MRASHLLIPHVVNIWETVNEHDGGTIFLPLDVRLPLRWLQFASKKPRVQEQPFDVTPM